MLNRLTNSFLSTFIAIAIGVVAFVGLFPVSAANSNKTSIYNSFAQTSAVSIQSPNNDNTLYYKSALDAFDAADTYAQENKAIGVVVSYGHSEQFPTPESVGDLFIAELYKRKEKAQYFVYKMPESAAVAIDYTNGMTSLGPLGLNDAAKQMNDFVLETRRLRANFSQTVPLK